MLFRRVKSHIKNEDWFAVFIDFCIVVAGVYIGLQLGNANEARSDKRAYQQAVDRFKAETETNLKALDELDKGISEYLKRATTAFDALQSCVDSPENVALVNSGVTAITGTYGLSVRRGALDELTNTPTLLAQQSPKERAFLTDAKYYFDIIQREANYVETIPLNERIQNNPIIGIGEAVYRNVTYAGVDFSRVQRPLYLKVPVSEACQNDALIKSFYTWERWQQVLPALSRQMRTELTEAQETFDM
ncbi:MAG: hypothetical protein ABJN69_02250 [Hellea sp.]